MACEAEKYDVLEKIGMIDAAGIAVVPMLISPSRSGVFWCDTESQAEE